MIATSRPSFGSRARSTSPIPPAPSGARIRSVWDAAVAAHDSCLHGPAARIGALSPATAIASRPVTREPSRLNEGFAWSADSGYRALHDKRFLPEEDGYWEATWYAPGDGRFELADVAGARVGLLICTELWSLGHAQRYGEAGAEILATPRATGRPTVDKWIAGGRAAAVVSGAYSLSSNWTAADDGGDFGGAGWIIDPDGQVLAQTSRATPFQTRAIDLEAAVRAKRTYPRYAIR